jgi:hypothetical protein
MSLANTIGRQFASQPEQRRVEASASPAVNSIREKLGDKFDYYRDLGASSTWGSKKITEFDQDEVYALLGKNLELLNQVVLERLGDMMLLADLFGRD